jgi:ribosome maturation factor RimP
MIDKATIREMVEKVIEGESLFLVDVSVTPSNKITILVDSQEGITINQCAVINRKLEVLLDRGKEDFDLVVSSPGLDSGLKVGEQYRKNVGRELEIIMKDNVRHTGVLKHVSGEEIIIEPVIKKRSNEKHTDGAVKTGQRILLNDIRTAKVRIIFNSDKNG